MSIQQLDLKHCRNDDIAFHISKEVCHLPRRQHNTCVREKEAVLKLFVCPEFAKK